MGVGVGVGVDVGVGVGEEDPDSVREVLTDGEEVWGAVLDGDPVPDVPNGTPAFKR